MEKDVVDEIHVSVEPFAKLVIPAILKPESSIFSLKNLWIPAKNTPE